jgi:hypothetical protein
MPALDPDLKASCGPLNAPLWRGPAHHGHYEAWYLTLHHLPSGRAFWFRYTLTAPTDGGPGYSALWAFSFEPGGGGLEGIDRYPLSAFSSRTVGAKGVVIGVGPGFLADGAARGSVGTGDRRLAWDLRLERTPGGFHHVPDLLYRAGVASSRVVTPSMHILVSGTIEVGGERLELEDQPGEQGHVGGRRHAERWAWAHCAHFPDAPGVAFEGVSAQVRKLGMLLPPATPLCVHLPDRDVRFDSARTLWSPTSSFELGRWTFRAEAGERLLEGEINAPPESFISVEYADPNGDRAWVNHTEQADLRLRVRDRFSAEDFEARGTVAFEVGSRQRDPRVPRTLDLAAARTV